MYSVFNIWADVEWDMERTTYCTACTCVKYVEGVDKGVREEREGGRLVTSHMCGAIYIARCKYPFREETERNPACLWESTAGCACRSAQSRMYTYRAILYDRDPPQRSSISAGRTACGWRRRKETVSTKFRENYCVSKSATVTVTAAAYAGVPPAPSLVPNGNPKSITAPQDSEISFYTRVNKATQIRTTKHTP